MFADRRRQEILKLVEEQGSIRISNLGEQFDVTDMTIRRDIDYLSERGLVRRVHGGAISESARFEGSAGEDQAVDLATTFLKRNLEYGPQKERIGRRAQDLVEGGSTIIIDGGTTNEAFAKHLDPRLNLRVITHALNVAYLLSTFERCELFVPGGLLNRLTMSFSGREVERMYEELNADTLFLCASGVSLRKGLTDPTWLDTSIKRAMIRSSMRTILLIDSHKFELVSSRTFASVDEIDLVITDDGLHEDVRRRYVERDVKLILA
jgi:DeoR/GlpR family transcriptional regulator of sugar metabolism